MMKFKNFAQVDLSGFNDNVEIYQALNTLEDGSVDATYFIGDHPHTARFIMTVKEAKERQDFIKNQKLPTYSEWVQDEVKLHGGNLGQVRW